MVVGNPNPLGRADVLNALVAVSPPRSATEFLTLFADAPIHLTNVVGVLWNATAEEFLEEWRGAVGESPAGVELVAVGASCRSAEVQTGPASSPVSPVTVIPGSDELADVLAATRDALEGWDGEPVVLYVDALDALFDVLDRTSVVRFVEELTDVLDDADTPGVFAAAPDGETLLTGRSVFDVVLEFGAGSTDEPAADDRARRVDADTMFDVLRHRVRRIVIEALLEAGGPVETWALAERVVERTGGDGPETHREAYVGLHHVHLPRLEDHDFVSLAADGGIVEALEAVEDARPYLALARSAP